ncbi:hypothetical protein PanWU01x14_112830 [Parasponia andersonii]|uniref:Transposase, Ptta/En/Spm, plant n=1 Tax=Parasponia andersonii TaxID=3476 RepID=A0A2P5CYE8_PARAD|nr:hypothetical protein PanWU01x14_112830 [Parasponia andersonii]
MHFIIVGGKEALAAAKAKSYKNIPEDHWEILSDHFASKDVEKDFSQNSEKRSKQLYAPGPGSLSIIGHIHKEGNPETVELMSPIDCFEEKHFKNNSWRNENTQQKHAKMVASREEALTQAQAQAHKIADPVDLALSAESIVGSLPRLKSVGVLRAASISNVAAVQREHAETITSMKQQLAEKDAEYQHKLEEHQAKTQRRLDDQQWLLQSLIAQLDNNGLNIQLLPLTQPPPPPSSQ